MADQRRTRPHAFFWVLICALVLMSDRVDALEESLDAEPDPLLESARAHLQRSKASREKTRPAGRPSSSTCGAPPSCGAKPRCGR